MSGHYDLPKHLSMEAKQLLKGILNIDPLKRLTIEQIRKSEFYLKNVKNAEPQIQLNFDIDEDVLDQLIQSTTIEPEYIK